MPQKLTPEQLQTLLTNLPPGATIELKKTPQGDLVVTENHSQTKDDAINRKYAHLRGQGITISEAAEKYDVPRPVITSWIYRSNYVGFLDETSYPKLVDEAEVALCVDIYRARKAAGSAGLPYFDEQGFIITEVKRPASSRRKS